MGQFDALKVLRPRSPVSIELARLIDVHDELARNARAVEQSRDSANIAAREASEALAQLLRAQAGGADVTAAIAKAEKQLATARATAAEPWPEKIAGMNQAVTDAANAVRRFGVANYVSLADEIAEQAHAVKQVGDELLEALLDQQQAYSAISSCSTALFGFAALPEPQLVPESKLQTMARTSRSVLMEGGEALPVPRHAPVGAEAVIA